MKTHNPILSICLAAGVTLAADDPLSTSAPLPHGTNESHRLPEVLVTATQTEENTHSLPYSADVISRTELEQKQPRTVPEAFRELPSVMIQKTSHGQGSPFIRGFTGFRTLMLIDGIRLNNATFRDGPNQYWNTVDNLSLKQLELVRGPASVLYGSDAIGGTVNAITAGREEFSEGFDWDRRVFYRYSTAEQSHVGRAEISGNFDEQLGFLFGTSLKDFGNLRGGRDVGRQRKTGYEEFDWDAKVEYRLTPKSRLVFAHQTVNQEDAWRTHATRFGVSWEGTTVGSDRQRSFDQRRHLDYVQYHAEELGGFVDEVHVSVSRHLQDEEQFRIRSNRRYDVSNYDVNTLGISLQLQSPSPVGRWIYGAEYYRDWVQSESRSRPASGALTRGIQGPIADDASYDLAGVYAEDHIPLFSGRLEVIVGGRFTYAAADAGQVANPVSTGPREISISDDWNTLTGNARALYHIDEEEHWNVFGGVSQGFRAPNLSDLTRLDIAQSGELETPAPGLDPEQFISYEAGVKMEYNAVSAQAVYFYTMIDDLIVRVPTGNIVDGASEVTKRNSGKGHVHGIELSGSVRFFEQWTLWSAFTWMDGELEAPVSVSGPLRREPVSKLMPVTVNAGLLWEHPSQKYWAEAVGTFTRHQNDLSSGDRLDTQRIPPGGTPGYSILTLRAGWRPCKNFTLTATLENVTDEDYRIHGSGLNEPGRNLVIAGDFRF